VLNTLKKCIKFSFILKIICRYLRNSLIPRPIVQEGKHRIYIYRKNISETKRIIKSI
jgi:hypothetical protein